MSYKKTSLSGALVVGALLLAGCNGSSDHQAAPGSPAATSTTTSSSQAGAGNAALTAAQVNVTVSMNGAPQVSSDGKTILATVKVANNGSVTLSSEGKNPVNLGAHSVDSSGKVVQLDLARASFAQPIPAGGTETLTISLPADALMGKSAEILPVQEGVAWFDTFGTKPLMVGPFKSCDGADSSKICDGSGQPLAVIAP